MKQCTTCGARGLFLELDKHGNCMKCKAARAEEIRREKQRIQETKLQEAEKYHDNLVRIYSQLPEDFMYSIPCDTVEIRKTVLLFEELLELLREYGKYERFVEVFITFLGTADQYGIAKHSVFQCQSYFASFSDPVIHFMDDMVHLLEKLSRDYQQVARNTDSFYKQINTIEHSPVIIEPDAKHSRKSLSDFPDIPLMNMTKRTNDSIVSDFIVIDLETTGLKASINEIIQMCALRFEGGSPAECFLTYVRPLKGINREAQQINGITEDMIQGAPLIEQVMNSFDAFVSGGLPLVGHNILFDLKFLYTNGSKIPTQKRKFYDTCSLAKKAYPDSQYSLDYLCDNMLRIARNDNHSALSDCTTTGLLFVDIKKEIDNA